MRQISGMSDPSLELGSVPAATGTEVMRVLKTAMPAETVLQRFDRFVRHAKAFQPKGIVEVVLAEMPYQKQKEQWHDLLLERGFELVNENKNSNTMNMIYVYHLNLNVSQKDQARFQEEIRKEAAELAAAQAPAPATVSPAQLTVTQF